MEFKNIEIEKYCGNIQERIQSCRNRNIAEMLKDRMCMELGVECRDNETINRLRNYVDEIILQTFDKSGMNKKLEN